MHGRVGVIPQMAAVTSCWYIFPAQVYQPEHTNGFANPHPGHLPQGEGERSGRQQTVFLLLGAGRNDKALN
jgi:hypothetical protein